MPLRKKATVWKLAIGLVVGLNLICPIIKADDETAYSSSWHGMIMPYLWMVGVSGDLSMDNATTQIDLSFSDIWKDLQFDLQSYFEIGYDRLTFMIDPLYLKLSENLTTDRILSNLIVETTLIDSGIYYRIFNTPPTTSLELLGGSRYVRLKNDLTVGSRHSLFLTEDSFTPIVGYRLKHYVNHRIQLVLRGDIGGFHINNMNNTWSATAGFYYVVTKHIDLNLSYRVLKIDYFNESDNFMMNTLIYGPIIGISFH